MRFSLCENKKAKYGDNIPFDFPFFNERQTKTTQPIEKLFLLIDSWIANYQITKCVLHWPANLKIQLKPSMSEIRNSLVSQPNKLIYKLGETLTIVQIAGWIHGFISAFYRIPLAWLIHVIGFSETNRISWRRWNGFFSMTKLRNSVR